jgi:hypothetical protein
VQFVAAPVVDAEKPKKPAEEKPKENDKKPKVRNCSSSPHFRALKDKKKKKNFLQQILNPIWGI